MKLTYKTIISILTIAILIPISVMAKPVPSLEVDVVVLNPEYNINDFLLNIASVNMAGPPTRQELFDIKRGDLDLSVARDGSLPMKKAGDLDRIGTYISLHTSPESIPFVTCPTDKDYSDHELFPYQDPWVSDEVNQVMVTIDFAKDGVPMCKIIKVH